MPSGGHLHPGSRDFDTGDIGAQGVIFLLDFIQAIVGLGLLTAYCLDLGLDFTLFGNYALELGLLGSQGRFMLLKMRRQPLPTQCQQFKTPFGSYFCLISSSLS